MKKNMTTAFFISGAITMIVMSLHYFQYEISGILKGKSIASNSLYRILLKSHILFGIIAITLGPFQFLKNLRVKLIKLHKSIGYVYFVSVIISAFSGLVVAQYAMGGWISSLGFTVLSVFWLFSTISAIISIKKGNIVNHKKWMVISYALTFAAIPQRTMLLVPLLTDVPFIIIYKFSAWIPWILNAYIAYRINKNVNKKTILV